jgi:hypothetical protein
MENKHCSPFKAVWLHTRIVVKNPSGTFCADSVEGIKRVNIGTGINRQWAFRSAQGRQSSPPASAFNQHFLTVGSRDLCVPQEATGKSGRLDHALLSSPGGGGVSLGGGGPAGDARRGGAAAETGGRPGPAQRRRHRPYPGQHADTGDRGALLARPPRGRHRGLPSCSSLEDGVPTPLSNPLVNPFRPRARFSPKAHCLCNWPSVVGAGCHYPNR